MFVMDGAVSHKGRSQRHRGMFPPLLVENGSCDGRDGIGGNKAADIAGAGPRFVERFEEMVIFKFNGMQVLLRYQRQ